MRKISADQIWLRLRNAKRTRTTRTTRDATCLGRVSLVAAPSIRGDADSEHCVPTSLFNRNAGKEDGGRGAKSRRVEAVASSVGQNDVSITSFLVRKPSQWMIETYYALQASAKKNGPVPIPGLWVKGGRWFATLVLEGSNVVW